MTELAYLTLAQAVAPDPQPRALARVALTEALLDRIAGDRSDLPRIHIGSRPISRAPPESGRPPRPRIAGGPMGAGRCTACLTP